MRKIFLMAILLAMFLSLFSMECCAETGRIKKRTEYMYKFVERFGEYKPEIQEIYIYKYDEKGDKIEEAKYDGEGKLGWKYIYDERGNEIEYAEYGSEEELIYKEIYKYDERGNEIEYAEYGSEGRLEWKYIYKYDGKGNKVEKIEYTYEFAFGEIQEIPKEKIIYEHEYH